jgi:prolyl-tRNA editing enzyme YbaK/EbsC (Cys-tRNA(Pro) deacylase)
MPDNSAVEAKVIASLDSIGLPYEVVEIDPDFADTAAFCEKYGFPPEQSANTIIVATKKEPRQYVACVARATARLDVNHRVKQLMGNGRVSFARGEETVALTGMLIGGVTALGLPERIPVYIDPGLMTCDYIILGGGSRSTKIKVSPEALTRIPGAAVIDGLTLSD